MIKKVRNKNMNVKLPEDDYRALQQIADDLGGMTLSGLIRMKIYEGLDKVRKTGNSKSFLNFSKND
jgi:hypothetical protein